MQQDIWRKKYPYDYFVLSSLSNHGGLSRARNTTDYCIHYFKLSTLLEGSCRHLRIYCTYNSY